MIDESYTHGTSSVAYILISFYRKPEPYPPPKGSLILGGVLHWPHWHRLVIGWGSTTVRLKSASVKF